MVFYLLRKRMFRRSRILFMMCLSVFGFLFYYYYLDCLGIDGVNCSRNANIGDEAIVVLRESQYNKEYIDKRGIHVIVGQYMGKGLPWEANPNISNDLLNTNNYSPISKSGENGMPVYIPEWQAIEKKTLFHINRFNLLASDRISVNRSLPDPRKQSCRNKVYDLHKLSDTSVIIVFHNEAWSTLVRTVHSVINRSPHQLLKEIILVDDASDRDFLGAKLDDYMEKLSNQSSIPVRIMRAVNRTGLIRARLLGANIAKGKVLTFLDAHCETTVGWLEPLLARVTEDKRNVVCPIIDIINDETFAFARSFELHWGAFNWELHFRWYPIGQRELLTSRTGQNNDHIKVTQPFRSPIMAGGLFAIDKSYFYEMGSYDDHMNIWGGENIEMSLRIWQCGGRIEIVPCSHVAHLFRRSSPYTFGNKDVGEVLYTNLARVAEVWLDNYKNFFYKLNPIAARVLEKDRESKLENISKRVALRKKLGCKSFEWYLNNVWPEHFFPANDRFYGKIRSKYFGECLQRPTAKNGSPSPVGKVELEKCAIEIYSPQNFIYTKHGFVMTDESVCLDVSGDNKVDSPVYLLACNELKRQKWKYDAVNNVLIHLKSNLCLDANTNRKSITLQECSQKDNQIWEMISIDWQ